MKLGGANNGVYVSDSHKPQVEAARKAGLKVDHYWFNGRSGTFDAQAKAIANAGIRADETVWWDVEDEEANGVFRSRWTEAELMKAAEALAALGVPLERQGVYLSSSVTRASEWRTAAQKLRLWVADYGTNDGTANSEPLVGYWKDVDLWQYTSQAKLPGHGGGLDISRTGKDVWTVYDLQVALNKILNANLVEDGEPGPATAKAIRTYQERNGLTADGVAGPITLRHISSTLDKL